MGELVGAEPQIVLLTATMPPQDEETMFQRMYWQREEVCIIRASTVRKNIRYGVVDGGRRRAQRDATLEQIVTAFLERDGEGKALIMCNSKPGVERIAASGMFPCEYYHADVPRTAQQKLLQEFREGRFRVIAATGTFGTGIDVAGIHLVVHMDDP